MSRISVELTNRCNLNCLHCLDGRHNGDSALKMEIIEKVLQSARGYGFNHLSFTGGEPTLHTSFMEIISMVCEAGYSFGFVTNGWNFTRVYKKLLQRRDWLKGITFSLDGAREETHDKLRGKGSYRRVMKAVSICVVKDIPFNFNSVVTSHNSGELREIAEFTTKLGSRGLRFSHITSTPLAAAIGLCLSPLERREIESVIWQLRKNFDLPVVMASGFYTNDIFPCTPLKMQEFNIDWRGNVTMCCHLSGFGDDMGSEDVIGNLDEVSFSEAYEHLVKFNKKFRKDKLKCHSSSRLSDFDYFPCSYCLNYFNKVDRPKEFPSNAWPRLVLDK